MTAKIYRMWHFVLVVFILAACEQNNMESQLALTPGESVSERIELKENTQGGGGTGTCLSNGDCVVSDIFIKNIGERMQLSSKTKSYLQSVGDLIARYGITKPGFWSDDVISHRVEYRFVQSATDLPCPEKAFVYSPIGSPFEFGCTDGDMTFLVEPNFNKFQKTEVMEAFEMKSLAILHERLHAICPDCSSGPRKIYITEFVQSVYELLKVKKAQDGGDRSKLTDVQVSKIYQLYYRALNLGFRVDDELIGDHTGFAFTVWKNGGGILLNESVIETSQVYPEKEENRLYKKLGELESRTELPRLERHLFIGIGSYIINPPGHSPVSEVNGKMVTTSSGVIHANKATEVVNTELRNVTLVGGTYKNMRSHCSLMMESAVEGDGANNNWSNTINFTKIVKSAITQSRFYNAYDPRGENTEYPGYHSRCHQDYFRFVFNSEIKGVNFSKVYYIENAKLSNLIVEQSSLFGVVYKYLDNQQLSQGLISESSLAGVNAAESIFKSVNIGSQRWSLDEWFGRVKWTPVFANDFAVQLGISNISNCHFNGLNAHGVVNCLDSRIFSDTEVGHKIYVEGDLSLKSSSIDFVSSTYELRAEEAPGDRNLTVQEIKTAYDADRAHYQTAALHIDHGVELENKAVEINTESYQDLYSDLPDVDQVEATEGRFVLEPKYKINFAAGITVGYPSAGKICGVGAIDPDQSNPGMTKLLRQENNCVSK